MIRTAAALVLCLTVLAGAAAAQAPYVPPEGDFSVAFPAAPTVSVQPARRSRDVARRRYVAQEPSQVMVVSIDDYPDGELPQSADAGVYEKILRTRAQDENADLVSTRAARLAGRPCLEGRLVYMNGVVQEIRVLLIGDRLYQLAYLHPDGADPQGADAAFFASFRITGAPGPAGER